LLSKGSEITERETGDKRRNDGSLMGKKKRSWYKTGMVGKL
jgi:hypothetical protein